MSRRFVLSLGCPDRIGIVARIATFLAELGGTIVEAAYHSDEDSRWFFTRQSVDADSIGMDLDELRRRFGRVAEELGPETDWQSAGSAEPKDVVVLASKEGHCPHDLLGRVQGGDFPAPEDSRWFFPRQSVDADSIGMDRGERRRRFGRVAEELGPETDWQIAASAEPKDVVVLASKEGHCLHDLLGRVEGGDFPARIRAVVGNHENLRAMTEAHGVPFHHVPFPSDPAERGPAFEEVASLVDDIDPRAIVLARFMQV